MAAVNVIPLIVVQPAKQPIFWSNLKKISSPVTMVFMLKGIPVSVNYLFKEGLLNV
jgi:hypothetical protein